MDKYLDRMSKILNRIFAFYAELIEERKKNSPLSSQLEQKLLRSNIDKSTILSGFFLKLDRNLDKINLLYKPAKLYNGGGDLNKTWFVYYYTRNNSREPFTRTKITGDINRLLTVKDRQAAGEILVDIINYGLESGLHNQKPSRINYSINAIDCIQENTKSKIATLRHRSAQTYSSRVNLFCDWLRAKRLERLYITDINPIHVQAYIDYLIKENKSAVTINSTIEVLKGIFNRLLKLRIIKENPFMAIDRIRENESELFDVFTDEEINKISVALKKDCPGLYLFMLHIYYCFLRPASIVTLKRSNYDFTALTITVKGIHHKNRKTTVKQLLEPLRDELIKYGVDSLPPDQYLFSVGLVPGLQLIQPVRASELWKKYVIDGLGINKKMYGLKHTGGINYLNDNSGVENVRWLQNQMGHSSLEETDTYIKKGKVVQLDESKAKIRKF